MHDEEERGKLVIHQKRGIASAILTTLMTDSHGLLQTLTDTHSFYSRLFGPSSFTLSDHHVRPPMPPCNGIAPRLYTTPFYPGGAMDILDLSPTTGSCNPVGTYDSMRM